MSMYARELRATLSNGVTDTMRITLACISIAVGLLFFYFSHAKQLPMLEKLSHHQVKAISFSNLIAQARLISSGKTLSQRELGYAFEVPWASLPVQYDKSESPPVDEPRLVIRKDSAPISQIGNGRYLFLHEALKLQDHEVHAMQNLTGQMIDLWFWESKIVVVSAGQKQIIAYERAKRGLGNQYQFQWIWAGLSFLIGIVLLSYPKLLLSKPSQ